jgi:hypothetical protein
MERLSNTSSKSATSAKCETVQLPIGNASGSPRDGSVLLQSLSTVRLSLGRLSVHLNSQFAEDGLCHSILCKVISLGVCEATYDWAQ